MAQTHTPLPVEIKAVPIETMSLTEALRAMLDDGKIVRRKAWKSKTDVCMIRDDFFMVRRGEKWHRWILHRADDANDWVVAQE